MPNRTICLINDSFPPVTDGVANAVVLNEDTGRIAAALPEFFDRVLVDAPCSGEGMFRKESVAVTQYDQPLLDRCAALGAEILENAAAMLAPGGILVYSTCTFAPGEDEGQIAAFLARHPEFTLCDLSGCGFGQPGEANRAGNDPLQAEYCRRIWPCDGGEGHFMAKLQKAADALGLTMPDCDAYEQAIEEKVQTLREQVGDTHIAIDYTATPRPLELAAFLLTHGFNVYAIYLDEMSPDEKETFQFLREQYPDLSLRSTSHFKRRLLPRDDSKKYGKVLAIGQMAAYFTDTKYFVNLVENGGFYGYTGLLKILDLIGQANAAENPKMRDIIQIKAWGCHG